MKTKNQKELYLIYKNVDMTNIINKFLSSFLYTHFRVYLSLFKFYGL